MPAHARIAATALAACLLAGAAGSAEARPRRTNEAAGSSASGGSFGLGIILGGPTGVSGKYYMSGDLAIDFAVGYYYGGFHHDDGLGLHADLLWHPVRLASTGNFDLPLYLGVGARIVDDEHRDDHDLTVGLRVPIGIAFEFSAAPLDLFLELAALVEVIDNDDDRVGLDGALGVRYWF